MTNLIEVNDLRVSFRVGKDEPDGPVEALERGLLSTKPDVRVGALDRVAKAAVDLTPEQRRKEALLLRKFMVAEQEPSSGAVPFVERVASV